MGELVLSLFPGVDLFGRAFEAEGFSVVRGPDLLWGGDIRRFSPPAGAFAGVIGGSPCQDFSAARRGPASGAGRALMAEFARVVREAGPQWYVLENVPRAPDCRLEGYAFQRIDVQLGWYSGVSRLRHFQFGTRAGSGLGLLQIPRGRAVRGLDPAALANDSRGFREVCRLQGLPDDFELPAFTVEGKIRAVGNGVPMVLGRVVAREVRRICGLAVRGEDPQFDRSTVRPRHCRCGCGREVRGKKLYDSPACRKRAQRARDLAAAPGVTRSGEMP